MNCGTGLGVGSGVGGSVGDDGVLIEDGEGTVAVDTMVGLFCAEPSPTDDGESDGLVDCTIAGTFTVIIFCSSVPNDGGAVLVVGAATLLSAVGVDGCDG